MPANFSTSALIDAGNLAADWVCSGLSADGSFPGVEDEIEAYYKMPVLFALADRPAQAEAVTAYLHERFFDGGDFHGSLLFRTRCLAGLAGSSPCIRWGGVSERRKPS